MLAKDNKTAKMVEDSFEDSYLAQKSVKILAKKEESIDIKDVIKQYKLTRKYD